MTEIVISWLELGEVLRIADAHKYIADIKNKSFMKYNWDISLVNHTNEDTIHFVFKEPVEHILYIK